MSPEQKAGQEVTTRSDIYALGLVLHEMFTGKSRKDTQTNPSASVKDLDPAIERLILRCLEEEPKRRPSSALARRHGAARRRPHRGGAGGGRNAVARNDRGVAGEGGIQPACGDRCVSWAWCCPCVIGLWLAETTSFLARAPLPIPPDALADRAQQLLKTIGYPEEPRSTGLRIHLLRSAGHRGALPLSRRRAALRSWRAIVPPSVTFSITSIGPSRRCIGSAGPFSGELGAGHDLRATGCRGQAPAAGSPAVGRPCRDRSRWIGRRLFSAAGLDPGRFVAAAPESIPPMSSDARLAWTGTYRRQPDGAGPRGGGVVAGPAGIFRSAAVSGRGRRPRRSRFQRLGAGPGVSDARLVRRGGSCCLAESAARAGATAEARP